MTVNRYEKLSQYLHCNHAAARIGRNHPDYHPIAKVAPVVDMAREKFKMYYKHDRDISIDEAMKGFKGRTELRMYMPQKPEKFGIKFWARCDGRTAYMSDFIFRQA
uniref:PiggyBac transposable element-derived protein domain-containing protein n=1 Tax=Knipowitschia caucasica TaxID=637954 RepID=A0AAV2K8I3_KNICA